MYEQYEYLESDEPEFIVDAGANIGLTSLYLLHRFPMARLIVIEPDPENFILAEFNLAPFVDRCFFVNGGLWSHDSTLAIRRGDYRDGRHWATQTIPIASHTDETIPVFHIQTLLDRFGFPRIDLLKIDIEGAERDVFGNGDTSFLAHTRCCAVECHDNECAKAFASATTRHGLEAQKVGELTIARKIDEQAGRPTGNC